MLAPATVTARSGATRLGLLVAVCLLAALIGFKGALLDLVTRWIRQEEYSHGFLIPIIAAWLLWARRDVLHASIGQPTRAGAALIMLAISMNVVGELSAIFVLCQIGFVVALLGIALGIGGYSLLKVTWAPIILLLFAIPLPYFIEAVLTWRLQLIASAWGVFVIRLFQIPVYLEGNIIDFGHYKLQVVEACSGLRYLYPLLSLGFLASYFFQAPVWQRAAVFLSTIPITMFMNSLRIGLVGVSVNYWGTQMADELLHFFEGWVVFLVCTGLLIAEMSLLARLSGRSFFDAFALPRLHARFQLATPADPFKSATMVACPLLLLAGGVGVLFLSGRAELVPERLRFVTFPSALGAWEGRASLLEPQVENGLGLEDYVLSDYSRSAGGAVNLYIAYYASQRKGVSPHSPIVCMPGGGWRITTFDRTRYVDDRSGAAFPLNRAIIEKNSTHQLVYYWFVQRGRYVANEYIAKWYLFVDAIVQNRTDGALVRVTTPIVAGEREREADARLQSFIRELQPKLRSYLPAAGSQNAKRV